MDPQILTSLISAIIGGFVVHVLSAQRDRINKRREQRISYLIEAYRRLETCSGEVGAIEKQKLESAIADIQLLGTPTQVELVQQFSRAFAANGTASLDDLLQELRADLRAELRLEVVPEGVVHLHIEDPGVSQRRAEGPPKQ